MWQIKRTLPFQLNITEEISRPSLRGEVQFGFASIKADYGDNIMLWSKRHFGIRDVAVSPEPPLGLTGGG